MTPTRRRLLSGVSATAVSVTAGCLDGIIADEDDYESESGDGNENEGGDNNEDESGEAADDESDTSHRLEDRLEDIITELQWFDREYDRVISEYRDELQKGEEEIDDLLKTLEDSGSISEDEFEASEQKLNEVASTISDLFDPQFSSDSVYNLWGLNRQYTQSISRYIEINDWSAVEDELVELRRVYRRLQSGTETQDRFPESPIDNRLYDWLGDENLLFETRLVYDQNAPRQAGDGHDEPGYGRYVIDDASRSVRYDPFVRSPPRETLTEAERIFGPVSVSEGRVHKLYLNVHSIGSEDEINTAETEYESAFIQQYRSESESENAVDSLESESENRIDGTETFGDESWEMFGYMIDGERVYSYIKQVGAFVVCIEPKRTIWENQEGDEYRLLPDSTILAGSRDSGD